MNRMNPVFGRQKPGTFVFELLLWLFDHFNFDPYSELLKIAQPGSTSDFAAAFFRAIFAGWLIALMIWLLPFGETGRVTIIIILTYLIGIGGFVHIIAGSVDAISRVLQTPATVGSFFTDFFLPALLGDIIGGVAFVAIPNHAQIGPDRPLTGP
jgi:formate-nitrite transporter family protein